MEDAEMESLRDEFLEFVRGNEDFEEEVIAEYSKFMVKGRGMKGPLLYISLPGRNVVHIKNVEIEDSRWTLIEKSDPKKVGRLYEIRIQDDPDEVRGAFYAGFGELVGGL